MKNEIWYKNLKKAPWSPKPPVFGAVWSVLYIMMAIALYLVWTNKNVILTAVQSKYFLFNYF